MKVELQIPESLNDITLGQYQKFQLLEEPTNEDLLCIFLNADLNVIKSLKQSKFDKLVTQIDSLFIQEQEHKLRFNLNGVSLGFIPNLDDITYGENKDVTAYISDWQTMHKAMNVLYRPIKLSKKGKYIITDYQGTRESDIYKEVPLSIVMGAMVFFYNLTNELLKAIPNYLEREMLITANRQTAEKHLTQSGEAMKKSIHLLKEILEDLMMLRPSHCINV